MAEVIPTPISQKEAELLQRTFKGNEPLLKTVRSLFFGFDISKDEKEIIKTVFSSSEVKEAFRKKVYPILSNDMPIGQVADFWLGSEQNLLGAHKDLITQVVESKQMVKTLLERAFELLNNPYGEKIDLSYEPSRFITDPLQTFLLARNLYIKTVEQGLLFVKLTAEQETKIPEVLKEKRRKDSAR